MIALTPASSDALETLIEEMDELIYGGDQTRAEQVVEAYQRFRSTLAHEAVDRLRVYVTSNPGVQKQFGFTMPEGRAP